MHIYADKSQIYWKIKPFTQMSQGWVRSPPLIYIKNDWNDEFKNILLCHCDRLCCRMRDAASKHQNAGVVAVIISARRPFCCNFSSLFTFHPLHGVKPINQTVVLQVSPCTVWWDGVAPAELSVMLRVPLQGKRASSQSPGWLLLTPLLSCL